MTTASLVITEHDNARPTDATRRSIAAAGQITPGAVDLLVIANHPEEIASQAACLTGVRRVLSVCQPGNAGASASSALAPAIVAALDDCGNSHLLAPNTTFGKDVLPRVAALVDAAMVTDIAEIIDAQTFRRPIYAGNAYATVSASAAPFVIGSIRCASFDPVGEARDAAPIEAIDLASDAPTHTRVIADHPTRGGRPDLQSAERVVVGGRGVGSAENFDVIYGFADHIGAAVGASRAAVDAGYAPNELQVGQTGRIIAPRLYFGFGVSGAIQHLAGIKDAGTIVAINTDADAPIFEIADIGLVGDLFDVIPALAARMNALT